MFAWRDSISDRSAPHASADRGSWRTTTSTSPPRRQVVISSSLIPGMSRSPTRSVSAISDSGMPNSRSMSCVKSLASPTAARNSSVSTAARHMD